jgi:hypothetical protein
LLDDLPAAFEQLRADRASSQGGPMEASIVLVLVLGVLVGGMTLMLAVGYVSTENERARREAAPRAKAPSKVVLPEALPSFFDATRPAVPIAFVFDNGLVHRVEDHVRGERAIAAQFIHHPSVETLYRKSETELRAN